MIFTSPPYYTLLAALNLHVSALYATVSAFAQFVHEIPKVLTPFNKITITDQLTFQSNCITFSLIEVCLCVHVRACGRGGRVDFNSHHSNTICCKDYATASTQPQTFSSSHNFSRFQNLTLHNMPPTIKFHSISHIHILIFSSHTD